MGKELLIFWILAAILLIELAMMAVLVYFSKFVAFFQILFVGLRLASPLLFILNIVFLAYSLFGKGKTQTARSWMKDLRHSLKFFVISLVIAVVTISVCSFLGALLGISADRLSNWPTLQQMREWVASQLY